MYKNLVKLEFNFIENKANGKGKTLDSLEKLPQQRDVLHEEEGQVTRESKRKKL